MASAESLKILRSLQSRPENKVRDVTSCMYQVRERRGAPRRAKLTPAFVSADLR